MIKRYTVSYMNPFIVGVINALIPGLGYLLIRERIVFGWLTLASLALYTIVMFTDPSPAFTAAFLSYSEMGRVIEALSYGLGMLAFGYDAYALARHKRMVTV